ncbi:DUF4214 domain-containing protein [Massilia sp. W12]|uniref:DUF4214 domain-containing protein n=1 Tax=Massilia sp. W12 TaxID=3126507 RepID=UPI0030D26A85
MGQYTAAVQKLYVAYFNRPADPVGQAFWEGVVASKNGDTSAVSAFFSTSAEYTATYAGMTNEAIINTIYRNLFGRDAEVGGLLYWSQKLAAGDLTMSNVVTEVSKSAVGADLTAYNSKVSAATVFTNALDTTPEILAYNNKDAIALGRTFLTGVTDEATQATAEGGIDATILNVVAAADAVNNKGQTYNLTIGIDTFTGGKGNDTFASTATTASTLTSFDNLDGGLGNDTLTVVSATGATLTLPDTAVIKNIEAASLTADSAISGNVTKWTGLTSLTAAATGDMDVTLAATTDGVLSVSKQTTNEVTVNGGDDLTLTTSGATTGDVTIGGVSAPAGAVVINHTSTDTASYTSGDITVTGGKTVSITQNVSTSVNKTATQGSVTVNGGASTTSVSVTGTAKASASATVAGVQTANVFINDVNGGTTDAGTITSVSVTNFGGVAITGNALTSLSLKGGSSNMIIDNSGLKSPTNKTLALSLDGQTSGTLDDADIYTTLNVTTTGTASTLANITFGALTKLTVAGTKGLTLTSTAGLTSMTTAVVSGSAGLTADLSGAKMTSIDTSASSGSSKITVDASKATYTGGAGVDAVTTTGAVSKAISLGGGDDSLALNGASTVAIDGGAGTDSLTISAASAATASADTKFAGLVTNFERLVLTGSTNQTIDLAVLGNFNHVSTSGGNGLTLNNLPSNGTLLLTGAGTAYTVANSAFSAGKTDVLNVSLTDGSGAGVAFASTGITAANVETIAITVADTQATPSGTFNNTLTLLGNSASTITVSGNAGLSLTAASTALTSLDASGISLGGFAFTTGALAAAATIKGSATGDNKLTATAATAAVTYTGGTGDDDVTIGNAKNNVVALGDGANKFSGGAGSNTVTAGKGDDTITVGNGNNTITVGDGANTVTAGSGNNTITGGAGVDTITVGGGINTITLGAGKDVVTLSASGSNVNTYSTIVDPHAGVTLTFGDLGTEVFGSSKIALTNTAVFQDYANAVIQAGGNASANGYFGWFQFNGDTYLVQSRHDGSGVNASFVNGTDAVIKLTGLVDLSAATLSGNSLTLA